MSTSSSAARVNMTHFKSPQTVIARFVAQRTLRSATVWAFIIGAYTASKVIGYAKAYPTTADKVNFAHTLGSNSGMSALLGTPHDLASMAGYANWVTMGIISLIGAVWALLLATKHFRGEEESGRSELLLTGQTTASRAALSTLLGLSANLLLLYVIIAAIFIGIGKYQGVSFSLQNSLFFALAATSGAIFFLSIGAFTSQLMPTRSRASTVGAVIFGASLILRAIADSTSQHWVLNITPLGWIEKLLPLVGSKPIWLLPILGSALVLNGLTVWMAGRRDLGSSIFADHDTAAPRTRNLNSPLQATIRMTRTAMVFWTLGIMISGFLYGAITKSVVQTLNETEGVHKALTKLDAIHKQQVNLATLFLGVIFLILMVATMAFVANMVGKTREDEAQGYLDNFLVQPVSRLRWICGRIAIVTVMVVFICICASLGVWAGQSSQHVGVPIRTLVEAGSNMIAPTLLLLGIGVLAFGVIPRRTTLVVYCTIGWSFLLSLIASGTSISHWVLDTSILHQVTLAPAVSPNWTVNTIMLAFAVVLITLGVLVFNTRDLASE